MSDTPFWDDSPDATGNTVEGPGTEGAVYMSNAWDTCSLQSEQIPGLVRVTIQSKKRRVQNKKQNGSDGATPTFRGLDPAKITIDVVLWTPNQYEQWKALRPIIFPNPNKDVNKLSALDISSSPTSEAGIKAIIVEDIKGPNDGPVKGSKIWSMECWEYLPPSKSAVKSPLSAVAVTPAFQQPTKNAPPAPSTTDFGPVNQSLPQQGTS